jgi:hypothetical protein
VSNKLSKTEQSRILEIFFDAVFTALSIPSTAFSVSGKVRDSNSEERTGVWGLNANIRRIRGELFNDMTPEEQVAYRETVKETKFYSPLFVALSLVAPVIAVVIYKLLDLGYLFTPVLIQ